MVNIRCTTVQNRVVPTNAYTNCMFARSFSPGIFKELLYHLYLIVYTLWLEIDMFSIFLCNTFNYHTFTELDCSFICLC